MSDVSTHENQGILGTLTGTIGKVAFFPIEVVKFGFVSAVNLITFVGTTSINLANNVLKTVDTVLQGIQSVVTPKK